MKWLKNSIKYCKKKLGLVEMYKSENIILLEKQFEELLVNAKKEEGVVVSFKGAWGCWKNIFLE